MLVNTYNFDWKKFLQPYELAVEGFILKIEGIRKQYEIRGVHCPIEIVSGRVKTPDSILDKAKRLGVEFEYIDEKVYDIGGIRITCKYIEDIYEMAKLLKARKDIVLLEERDYIKNPKQSGYRSLHLICRYHVETIYGQSPVVLEFQIRTHAMHFWASIEHSVKYKYQKNIPDNIKKRLLAASRAAEALDKEMSSIHEAVKKIDPEDYIIENRDSFEEEISLNRLKKW